MSQLDRFSHEAPVTELVQRLHAGRSLEELLAKARKARGRRRRAKAETEIGQLEDIP